MITHIQMKNFKSWQGTDIVKLAPLTGFFGTNSSGKAAGCRYCYCLSRLLGAGKFSSLVTKPLLLTLVISKKSFTDTIQRQRLN